MVRTAVKAKANSAKPTTTLKQASSKAKKEETFSNGHTDSERTTNETEIIPTESSAKIESTSELPEDTNAEEPAEEDQASTSKTNQNTRKRHAPTANAEVTEKKVTKVESASLLPDDMNIGDDEESAEETKSSASENSTTTQKTHKRKTPAITENVKEEVKIISSKKVESTSELPEKMDSKELLEDTISENSEEPAEEAQTSTSKTNRNTHKRYAPAVDEVKETEVDSMSQLPEDVNSGDAEETKSSASERSTANQKPRKRKTPAITEKVKEEVKIISSKKVESVSEKMDSKELLKDTISESSEEPAEEAQASTSKTNRNTHKRNAPAVNDEVKEKKETEVDSMSQLPENVDSGDAEETKSSASERSTANQKNRKRKIPAVTKKVKKTKEVKIKSSKKVTTELTKEVDSKDPVESVEVTKSSTSKANKKTLKRKTSAVTKGVNAKKGTEAKTKAKRQKVLLEVPRINSVSGKVFVIGENDVGQLGLPESVVERKRPALLDLPRSFVDIAAGGMHSVCLTESGEVITFGCNDEGALGRITSEEGSEYIPKKVDIPERIVQVSAGDSHSAALSDSGQAYVWGNFRSGNGPMGLVTDGAKQTLPVKILTGVTVVKVASGSDHLVCLSNEGVVYTCGCAEAGQLGRVSEHASVDGGRKGKAVLLTPDKVSVLKSSKLSLVNNIWTGSYSTFLSIQDSGAIYAFGLNNFSQLGIPKRRTNSDEESEKENTILRPIEVLSFNNKTWSQIIGGQHHTLALDDDDFVYALGRPEYGRLGLGDNQDTISVPTQIPRLQDDKCVDISCGNIVSFAVTDNGSVFSWGMGTNYQLGHGDDDDKNTPHQIEGNFSQSWKAFKIAGGGQHTLILATPKEGLKN